MTTRLGCIADDFTGATDLAAMLRRKGLSVTLTNGLPEKGDSVKSDALIVALKSRTIPPEQAVALSLGACRFLRDELGARAIYFKYCSTFDSTDRGNIGPVLDALMNELGVDRTIAAPGFPENGRRVFLGHLFVGDRLLSESSLASHPLTPMTDPDLRRVLSRQRRGPVAVIDVNDIAGGTTAIAAKIDAAPAGTVFICDAVFERDIDTIAAALSDLTLTSGGSPMGAAVGAALYPHRANVAAESFAAGLEPTPLYLSGSGSEMTRRQVRHALANGFFGIKVDPVSVADPDAPKRVLDEIVASGATRPLVYAASEPDEVAAMRDRLGREEAGSRLERFFEALAPLARAAGFSAFVVAGGETSGAVTQGLGIGVMQVGPEIAPGVPWMRSGEMLLALKSGNFGAESFFSDAMMALYVEGGDW